MKKVVLYSPGLSTMNLGDKVIAKSAKEELDFILEHAFTTEIATHLPQSYYYMRHLKDADYKFVLGSNLLKSTFFGFKRQWDITLRLSKITGPCVLMGAGWWQYNNKPNWYTKVLLKATLSKKYTHSVRDAYTEKMLKSMGINNVINTACPTMWRLTPEHCKTIRVDKSENVVFTLTDYNKDDVNDTKLINILLDNYKHVYFWPQGIGDHVYFNMLSVNHDKIISIKPLIESFDNLLDNTDIDYVGTRLHGGIRALQKKKRTIIISVDNRAVEKRKSFSLPVAERNNPSQIDSMIKSQFSTDISIPLDNINSWKQQFHGKSKV